MDSCEDMKVTQSLKNESIILQHKLNFVEKIYGGAYFVYPVLFFILPIPIYAYFIFNDIPTEGFALFLLVVVLCFGSLLVHIFAGRFPKITLSKQNRMFEVKDHQIQVSSKDAVALERRLIAFYRSRDSPTTDFHPYHRIKWFLYYEPDNQKRILLASYLARTGDGFDELAETIAEFLQIPLIDRTGEKEVTRGWGTTDEFIGKLISEGKVTYFKRIEIMNLPQKQDKWFQFEIDGPTFRLKFLKEPTSLALLYNGVKFFIGVYFLYYALNEFFKGNTNIFFFILIFFVVGILLYFVRRSYTVEVSPQMVTGRIKSILQFQRKFKELPTHSIERVLVFNDTKRLFLIKIIPCYGIELMSDHGRLKIEGIYTKEMAYELRNVLLNLFSQIPI